MPLVSDEKISQISPIISTIPSTYTTVFQDAEGGNAQAPVTGQSVLSNHTPVNYSSVGQQITQNLQGIDNALGAIGGGTVSFNVGLSGHSQSIDPTAPLPTVVEFDNEQFDIGNYYNSTTHRHTPGVAGAYCYFGQIQFAVPAIDAQAIVYILKNSTFGTYVFRSGVIDLLASASGPIAVPIALSNVEMNGSTDYMQIAVSVSGNGGSPVSLISADSRTYFGGFLCNQKGSSVTPSTVLQSIYVSKNGSDIDGDGTINFPFATITFATSYIVGLGTATFSNQYNIIIDTGTYLETGLKVYPNINWTGSGADATIITQSTAINFDSSWTGKTTSTASWTAKDLSLGTSTVLTLNSTGLSSSGGNINLINLKTSSEYNIINDKSSNTFNVNISNSLLALLASTNPVIDGVNATIVNSILAQNWSIEFQSNNADLAVNIHGDIGTSGYYFVPGSTHAVTAVILAGEAIPYTYDSSGGGPIDLEFDATTYSAPQSPIGNAIITNDFFNNLNTQTLTDAATVNWNIDFGINAIVTFSGNRIIANPTGTNVPPYVNLSLTMVQDNTGGWQPSSWGNNFLFPNGVPYINSLPGSLTTFNFKRNDNTLYEFQSMSVDKPNWVNWDLTNNIPAQSMTALLQASAGGVTFNEIPGTTNVLVTVCTGNSANIKLFVATVDSIGRLTIPSSTTWTTITPSTLVAGKPMVCVFTDGLNAIISYKSTTGGISCAQLTPIGISGTTITPGTTQQVRASEVAVGYSSVRQLDTSNFSLILRTTASNILYAYQCSLSAGVITVGSSPLTIETGNAATFDAQQAPIDSTHTMLSFRSTVTATAGFMYAAVLTFGGTGVTPTISTKLQLSTNTPAAASNALKVSQFFGNSGYFIFAWADSTNTQRALTMQVVQNSSGTPVSVGTGFASDQLFNNNNIAFFQPDQNHCIGYASNSDPGASAFMLVSIDSSYNMTLSKMFMPVNYSVLSGSAFTFIPINNNTMGLFGFVNALGNNIISYQTIRP